MVAAEQGYEAHEHWRAYGVEEALAAAGNDEDARHGGFGFAKTPGGEHGHQRGGDAEPDVDGDEAGHRIYRQ